MIFQEKSDDIWTVKLMNFFCNVVSHAMSGSDGTLSFVIPGLKITLLFGSCFQNLGSCLVEGKKLGLTCILYSGPTFQIRDNVFCFDSCLIALLLLSLCFLLSLLFCLLSCLFISVSYFSFLPIF